MKRVGPQRHVVRSSAAGLSGFLIYSCRSRNQSTPVGGQVFGTLDCKSPTERLNLTEAVRYPLLVSCDWRDAPDAGVVSGLRGGLI